MKSALSCATLLCLVLAGSVRAAAVDRTDAKPVAAAKPEEVLVRRPEGGLAYRLVMGPPGASRPALRLAVWLHPSGGRSYNDCAEGLAATFLRHGFALLLPIEKNFEGWTYDDARRLLGVTLPDAGRVKGVELERPLLVGFSSGGQVALEFWMTKPELYGGLILDAAHPAEERHGKAVIYAPPSGDAVRRVPLLVFVGEKDPLLAVWRAAADPWRKAGVPLTVHEVAGKGHEWLFGDAEKKELDAWLDKNFAQARPDQTLAPPHEDPDPTVHP